jgi:peptidoglycan/LPS O-acetylase OafA/YrhL
MGDEKAFSSQHWKELDGIRGWAALSVLIAHCITGPLLVAPPAVLDLQNRTFWLLLSGVDLFFVLSGFLIGGILIDNKGKPGFLKAFWIRRTTRILPVAYILLLSYVVALWVQSHWPVPVFEESLLANPRPPLWSVATFTQNFFFAVNGYSGPLWIGITWSLAIEEQFYVIFPFVVFFLSRGNLRIACAMGIVAAPFLRDIFEQSAWFPDWYGAYTLLPSRMDGLLFGVSVAIIVRDPRLLALASKYRILLDLLALWIFYRIVSTYGFEWWPSAIQSPFPPLKQSFYGLMWALVILRVFTGGGVLNAIWRSPVLGAFGMISYGLYMYHQAVNGLMHGLVTGQIPAIRNPHDLKVALAVMGIAIVVATISYFVMERPIRRFGRRLALGQAFRPDTPALPPASR